MQTSGHEENPVNKRYATTAMALAAAGLLKGGRPSRERAARPKARKL